MGDIRISKLAKEFNIGLSTVLEFLSKNGHEVADGNPNAKVPEDVKKLFEKEFGGEIYKYNGSHGCINMPYYNVSKLYDMVQVGTPVHVKY